MADQWSTTSIVPRTPLSFPTPTTLIASCLTGTSYLDTDALVDGTDYYYVARAEDLAADPDGGPCGGREEDNLIRRHASPGFLINLDFEDGWPGWSSIAGTPAATSGTWLVDDPVGTFDTVQVQPEDDHTPGAGVNCLFTAQNPTADACCDDVDGGEVMAVSPQFDASGFTSLKLSYWRWHYNRDVGEDPEDYFVAEVSNDGGGSWFEIERLDETRSENAWTEVTLDLETIVPFTAAMQIRFRSADGPAEGNFIESAIDDLILSSNVVCSDCLPTSIPGPVLNNLDRGKAGSRCRPQLDGSAAGVAVMESLSWTPEGRPGYGHPESDAELHRQSGD